MCFQKANITIQNFYFVSFIFYTVRQQSKYYRLKLYVSVSKFHFCGQTLEVLIILCHGILKDQGRQTTKQTMTASYLHRNLLSISGEQDEYITLNNYTQPHGDTQHALLQDVTRLSLLLESSRFLQQKCEHCRRHQSAQPHTHTSNDQQFMTTCNKSIVSSVRMFTTQNKQQKLLQ